jgi:hypothetical protein
MLLTTQLVSREGFEPTTPDFVRRCSDSVELTRYETGSPRTIRTSARLINSQVPYRLATGELKNWHPEKVSNFQPSDLEAAALPVELSGHEIWRLMPESNRRLSPGQGDTLAAELMRLCLCVGTCWIRTSESLAQPRFSKPMPSSSRPTFLECMHARR